MRTTATPILIALAALALTGCLGPQQRTETWPDGTPRATGTVQRGLQTGEWTYFHPDGSRQARGSWMMDKQVGAWIWWNRDGSVLQRGSYEGGLRHGFWDYRHPGGALKAQGRYHHGRQDGLWRFGDADGSPRALGSFARGSRHGLWWFAAGDGAAELGCYVDGVRAGPWLTWNGTEPTLRRAGLPAGWSLRLPAEAAAVPRRWVLAGPGGRRIAVELGEDHRFGTAVTGDGETRWVAHRAPAGLVTGPLPATAATGDWALLTPDGGHRSLALAAEGPTAAPADAAPADLGGVTGPDDGPEASALRRRAAAAAERVWRLATGAALVAADRSQPAPEIEGPTVGAVETSPTVEPPVTMTAADEKQLERSERVYRDGGDFSNSAAYGSEKNPKTRYRRDLIGQPLAQQRFIDGEGRVLDLADYRGERNLVLVVMRGFAGTVCPYCSGQTRALISREQDFDELDAEVLLCYPGAASSVPRFVKAVTGQQNAKLPLDLVLDVDLNFVRATGIEDELAAPTTFIVDKQGVIRYCYQGRDLADRPTVPDMLFQLRQIQAEAADDE